MKQTIAYIRVSSEQQATGDKVSLSEQAKALRELAERKGYVLDNPPDDLRDHLSRNLSPEVVSELAGCWADVFSGEALEKRREWLADAIRPRSVYRLSESFKDGAFLYRAAAEKGLEGIVAKRRGSPYMPGKHTPHWLKITTHPT